MSEEKAKAKPEHTTDMAGPETQRDHLTYHVPVPEEAAPVYFGGPAYEKEHAEGFSAEETAQAQEIARRSFDPTNAGEGRVQNWAQGVPERNKQGVQEGEKDDISTSAVIDDPTLTNGEDRNNL